MFSRNFDEETGKTHMKNNLETNFWAGWKGNFFLSFFPLSFFHFVFCVFFRLFFFSVLSFVFLVCFFCLLFWVFILSKRYLKAQFKFKFVTVVWVSWGEILYAYFFIKNKMKKCFAWKKIKSLIKSHWFLKIIRTSSIV